MEYLQKTDERLWQICEICCPIMLRYVPVAAFSNVCILLAWARQACLQAQLAVGTQGLPVLCTVVGEDRQDVEMLRGAVECLTIAIGHPARQSEASHKVYFLPLSVHTDVHE